MYTSGEDCPKLDKSLVSVMAVTRPAIVEMVFDDRHLFYGHGDFQSVSQGGSL